MGGHSLSRAVTPGQCGDTQCADTPVSGASPGRARTLLGPQLVGLGLSEGPSAPRLVERGVTRGVMLAGREGMAGRSTRSVLFCHCPSRRF